jgi:formylglycine-generating enzyme required for sulfatase activity
MMHRIRIGLGLLLSVLFLIFCRAFSQSNGTAAQATDRNGIQKPDAESYLNSDQVFEKTVDIGTCQFLGAEHVVSLKFVWIPAGEFDMGSPGDENGRFPDEDPIHRVKIANGFWMGKYEITQVQFMAVRGFEGSRDHDPEFPSEGVSWSGAMEFCTLLKLKTNKNIRLPSEAEWEYACRAGTAGACYGDLDEIAWHRGNSNFEMHRVGAKKPNAWGLYDMLGSVWEWCLDCYRLSYRGAPTDGSPFIIKSIKSNPERWDRVMRGGNWEYDARAAIRESHIGNVRLMGVGFRLVMPTE